MKFLNERKNMVAALIVFSALVVAVVGLAIECLSLQSQLEEKSSKAINLARESYAYKSVIEDNYLDDVVFVIKGDEKYYHRYGCPDTAMAGNGRYNYWAYNIEAAVQRGHIKCPRCFSYTASDYIEKYFK